MTPALVAVYEELVARAASAPFDEESAQIRRAFADRTGVFDQDHPEKSRRDAAAWEFALVGGGLARRILEGLEDESERQLAEVIARGQLGIFRLERSGAHRVVNDLWAGGSFVLLPRDDVGRGGAVEGALVAVFLGRIVAGSDGCAVLPGHLWLPIQALEPLDDVLSAARTRALTIDTVVEALMRMDHAFATLSRVKAEYAFRPAALAPPPTRARSARPTR